jgi:transcriptional regulator with XRE-family HTH domain
MPPTNSVFAALVRKTREQQGLSQRDLVNRSGMAMKTLVNIEELGVARFDSIVRLAHSLGQSPAEWLEAAGHEISQTRIEDILKQLTDVQNAPFRRLDPMRWFDRVESQLEARKRALICSVVTSRMPLDTPELRERSKELMEAGADIALVCPYPQATDEKYSEIPGLALYYNQVFGWTCKLARDLRQLVQDAPRRVTVFRPRTAAENLLLVPPPLRLNEIRPCMIKYAATGNLAPRYELGTYVRFTDHRPDAWIDTYSGEGEMNERVQEAFDAWHDYLSGVIESWTPADHASKYSELYKRSWVLVA